MTVEAARVHSRPAKGDPSGAPVLRRPFKRHAKPNFRSVMALVTGGFA
ncbi:hypothetical protein J2X63_001773 [Agromyces sp. 3263]|nr:hypothetical protein [Agromyces sp. 3263]